MDGLERRIPKRWTEAEDRILNAEARSQLELGQVKDWNRIAAKLPGRTNKDCRKRWYNKVCGSLKNGAWSEDEDERLREAVRIHGQRWTVIANHVGLRSPDQCAKRWQYSLDPRLEHSRWTPEEDETLLSLVHTHGNDWKLIHELKFPTRSRNELKNRHSTLSRKSAQSSNVQSICSSPYSPREDAPEANQARSDENPMKGVRKIDTKQDKLPMPSDRDVEMRLEKGLNDDVIPIDSWFDNSLYADWPQPQSMCFSNSPTAELLATTERSSSTSGGMIADSTLLSRPYKEEAIEPLVVATREFSASHWALDLSEMATSSEYSTIDLGYLDWTKNDATDDLGPGAQSINTSRPGSVHETQCDGKSDAEDGPAQCRGSYKRVSLVVDQCDSSTLDYLLSCVRKLKGKVRLEIDE